MAFYRCISFSRHGGSSSKNKQEYKPDVKLEYYDDNGRPLTPKEVRFIPLFPLFFSAFSELFSEVDDRFLCSHDLNVLFSSDVVRRN